jgi:hypothetical protein
MVESGDLSAFLIVIACIAISAALVGFVFLMVFLMLRLFAKASGLNKLADLYPAEGEPEGQEHTRQTIKVGAVRYRRCVTVIVNARGLYLSVQPKLSKRRPILIPWEEVKKTEKGRLYWDSARQLFVGEPKVATVTVFTSLFRAMHPYLSPSIVGDT